MSPGSTDEANCQPPSCRGRCAQVRRFRSATRCRSPAARGRNLPPAEMPCPPTRRPVHEAVSSGTDADDTHPSTDRRHVLPSTSGASSSIGSDRRGRVRIAGVRSTRTTWWPDNRLRSQANVATRRLGRRGWVNRLPGDTGAERSRLPNTRKPPPRFASAHRCFASFALASPSVGSCHALYPTSRRSLGASTSSCSSGVSIGVTPRNPWTPARGRDRESPPACRRTGPGTKPPEWRQSRTALRPHPRRPSPPARTHSRAAPA